MEVSGRQVVRAVVIILILAVAAAITYGVILQETERNRMLQENRDRGHG